MEWEHLHGGSVGERYIHQEYSSYSVFPQTEDYMTDWSFSIQKTQIVYTSKGDLGFAAGFA